MKHLLVLILLSSSAVAQVTRHNLPDASVMVLVPYPMPCGGPVLDEASIICGARTPVEEQGVMVHFKPTIDAIAWKISIVYKTVDGKEKTAERLVARDREAHAFAGYMSAALQTGRVRTPDLPGVTIVSVRIETLHVVSSSTVPVE